MCVCVYVYSRLADESDIHEGFLAWRGTAVALPWMDAAIRICYAPASSITLRNSCSFPSLHCQVLAELPPK